MGRVKNPIKGTQLNLPGTEPPPAAPPAKPKPKHQRAKTPKSSPWVSTTAAARELGCSTTFLYRRKGELFKRGTHFKVLNPQAWRPTYRWHLPNCQKLMEGEV